MPKLTLTCVAVGWASSCKVRGSGTCVGCGAGPWSGCVREAIHQCFSYCFSPSLPLRINKIFFKNVQILWYFSLQEVELKCDLDLVTHRVSNGKSRNFTVKKPGRHHLNQVTKVNIASNKTCWYHLPQYDAMRWARTSVVFSPKIHNIWSRETLHKPIIKKCPTKFLTSTVKKCQGSEKDKGKQSNCHRQEGGHCRDMMANCNVTFWIGSYNFLGH